jgi:hypothetical protein
MEDCEKLTPGFSALCFHCAQRLGKYTWPEIPELLLGQCPQCAGTRPLEPVAQPQAGRRIARHQRVA